MNLFGENSYREALKKVVSERKKVDSKFSFSKLATDMRIQRSYLSNAIQGRADLNQDQLYLAAKYLGLNPEQSEYLSLLLEHDRCSVPERKALLLSRVKVTQARHLDTRKHIDANAVEGAVFTRITDYYLDPLNQIVHVCLSIARYRKDLGLLASDLEIRPARLHAALQKLELMGIIRRDSGKIEVISHDLHLPRDSSVYVPWKTQLGLIGLQRLQQVSQENSYNFSVTFSAESRTREKIQAMFLALLKEIQPVVKDAKAEEAYQMNFDLFSWTRI